MPKFSNTSLLRLNKCHPDLILIAEEAIKVVDFSIECGYRDKVDQDRAFKNGNSKVRFPNSKHNKIPSMAFDFKPYPATDKTIDYVYIAGIIIGIARELLMGGLITHHVRYGYDFNRNDRPSDEKFVDSGHLELED